MNFTEFFRTALILVNISINDQPVCINLFSSSVPLLYPLKASENVWVFFSFQGGTETENWTKMRSVALKLLPANESHTDIL